MSEENLEKIWKAATFDDRSEGIAAYARYHSIMCQLSRRYSMPLERTVAVFVSLSPNSDYIGNLRSTVSVLAAIWHGVPIERVQVSTYRHCLQRAWAYGQGWQSFLDRTKGPKVRAFYSNVLDPRDYRHVTIDGHMTAIWRGRDLTMRQALVYSRKEYDEISNAIKRLAFRYALIPCEMQAVLWYARKRLKGIKYEAQHNLWPLDEPDMLEPYRERPVGPERVFAQVSRMPDIRG